MKIRFTGNKYFLINCPHCGYKCLKTDSNFWISGYSMCINCERDFSIEGEKREK